MKRVLSGAIASCALLFATQALAQNIVVDACGHIVGFPNFSVPGYSVPGTVTQDGKACVHTDGTGAVTIADGANVTQGAKADAAATDSTSSWSLVSIGKGIWAQITSFWNDFKTIFASPGSDATKAVAVQGVTGGKAVSTSSAQSGTWTMQPGNTPNTTPWLFSISPVTVTTTDKSGTITTGGTAQTPIALNASRKQWCIQNDPAATEVLYVRVNGTAAPGVGAALSPGDQVCSSGNMIDTAAVSVFAATTGHVFEGWEKQ